MSKAMWSDADGVVTCYMGAIDFYYELGGASKGNKVYPNPKRLVADEPYSCKEGIVKVEIRFVKHIDPEDVAAEELIARERKEGLLRQDLPVWQGPQKTT